MRNLGDDLLTEATSFAGLIAQLREDAFGEPTAFKQWSTNDVLRHLLRGDALACLAITDGAAFSATQAKAAGAREAGATMRDLEIAHADGLVGARLAARWLAGVRHLIIHAATADPAARVPWVAKSMSLNSLLSARLMEIWSHAQAVYDLLGIERQAGDHLFAVALLGARTYDWTFACRGTSPPGPAPRIALTAPSGAAWLFNETTTESTISGDSVEFCQVVCQVRNIADTRLELSGDPATRWMASAQCFAGPPHEPPPAGSRRRHPTLRSDLLWNMAGGVK